MNSIESVDVISYRGETETCALMHITDITSPYILYDVINSADDCYVLSFYAKSTANSTITVGNVTNQVNANWTKITVKIDASSENDVAFYFGKNADYYIYHVMLETGNMESDWSPAPEDSDASISTIIDQYATLTQEVDGFKTEVSKTYVNKDTIISTINQTAEAVSIDASKINLTGAVTFNSFDDTMQSMFSNSGDTTYINGAMILTGSITADKIDVTDLFSKSITATKFNLASGTVGGFSVADKKLTSTFSVDLQYYTESELQTVSNLILSGATPTAQQLAMYDIDGDGLIKLHDMVEMERQIRGYEILEKPYCGYGNKTTLKITITINPKNIDSVVTVTVTDSAKAFFSGGSCTTKMSYNGFISGGRADVKEVYSNYLRSKNDLGQALVCDNGTNLWIGAEGAAKDQHNGQLCLSTGWAGSEPSYYTTRIYVPTSATSADVYDSWHNGTLRRGRNKITVAAHGQVSFTITRPTYFIGNTPIVLCTAEHVNLKSWCISRTSSGEDTIVVIGTVNDSDASVTAYVDYVIIKN